VSVIIYGVMKWILIFYLVGILVAAFALNSVVREGLTTCELGDYPEVYGGKYISKEFTGNTMIRGNAVVSGNVTVDGNAAVIGNTLMRGNGYIDGTFSVVYKALQ